MIRTAPAAVALVAAVWALLHIGWYHRGQIVDYGVYQHYGYSVVHDHAVPYRDFRARVPAGSAARLRRPVVRHGDRAVPDVFQLLMAGCLASRPCSARLLRAGERAAVARRRRSARARLRDRLPLRPLAGGARRARARGRPPRPAGRLGGAHRHGVRGEALADPARAAPCVWIVRERAAARAAARWLGVAGVDRGGVVFAVPVLSPGGVAHSFHQQLARPLQLESLGAALLIACHHLVGHEPPRRTARSARRT